MTYFWLLCGATRYIFDIVLRCIQTFSWGSIFDRDLTFKGVLAAPVKRDTRRSPPPRRRGTTPIGLPGVVNRCSPLMR